MSKIRVVQVSRAGGPFELVDRDLPVPGRGSVRIKVQACGICHSDSMGKEGHFPGVSYPLVLGHEIAGVIDAVGDDVIGWKVGQRVGVGWFGGHCGHCEPCRRGRLVDCRNLRIPGINYDGGYAEAMIAPADALALIPDDLAAADAAPLLCAGVTTYNALRQSGAVAGDVVAILGVGGLGHLGIQFAARMGFHTVAIARGKDKEELSRRLGAHNYIDSKAEDVSAALTALGGARVILSTVTNSKAMSDAINGLGVGGKLVVVGASMEPIEVTPVQLISSSLSIQGHASGASIDSEDTLSFSLLANIKPMIETLPLERASEGYDRMMSGEARFRVVLTTGL